MEDNNGITWRKSKRSNGNGGNNCVEVGWRKASYSSPSGNCIEVSAAPDDDQDGGGKNGAGHTPA